MTGAIRGVIFDKDGTLFDFDATWGTWTRGLLIAESRGDPVLLARLADALGYDLPNGRFHRSSIVIAEPVDRVADTIMAVTGQTDRAALLDRMNEATAAVPQTQAADLIPLMARLRGMGLILGVVTNDAEAPALRHLTDAGILGDMAFVAGYDSGHGAKPDPAPLLSFAAATQIATRNCIMVGDSTHDLVAGRAAGMVCVGVLTGPALRGDLLAQADVVLDSIADLPGWIAAQTGGSSATVPNSGGGCGRLTQVRDRRKLKLLPDRF